MSKVAELNDAFRKSFAGGKIVMTARVADLPDMVRANALLEVARFDHFTPENDPHGEHDFGKFDLCGRRFFLRSIITTRPWNSGPRIQVIPQKPHASSR